MFLIFCFAFHLKAQQISFDQITNLPVSGLKNPWAGGINSVQFFPIDLDGDAQEDLVVRVKKFLDDRKDVLRVDRNGTFFLYFCHIV